ncbi:MAG: YegP family protein [Vicinamibacterales bacterium]
MKKSQYTPRIYQDRRGQWRWTLLHRNGRKVAASGEGFARRCHAVQMVRRLFGPLLVLALLVGCEAVPPAPTSPSPAPAPPTATTRSLRPQVTPADASVVLEPDAGSAVTAVEGVLSVPLAVTGGGRLCASAAGYYTQCVRVLLPLEAGALPPPIVLVRQVPGCDGRLLVDPAAYFFALINRKPGDTADDFVGVLLASGIPAGPFAGQRSDPTVHYGITQQRGGDGISGRVAGRIWLPTDVPDEGGYYTRPVNVLFNRSGGGLEWGWQEWGNPPYTADAPPYAPRACP